jgi:hypothetical protein
MSYYVLLDVGCLECNEPSTVLGDADEQKAREAFREAAMANERPILEEQYMKEDSEGTTTIALAGDGGSYWYPLQLHKIDVTE